MSYRKKHVKSKIGRIKPKKTILKKLWFWLAILFLVIILSGSYLLIFYSGFQLKDIIVTDNSAVKSQDLMEIISKRANAGLINFLSVNVTSRSIFLVDDHAINSEIIEKFPEIESVKINKILPQTLIVSVKERKPIGVFCPLQMSLPEIGNQCFLIDEKGVIFKSVADFPPDLIIVRQNTESGRLFLGEVAVPPDETSAIYKIENNLKDSFKIGTREATIASPTRLNVSTSENWKIYFDLSPDFDIDSQITKLNLLLSGELSADKRENLKYIDLRPKDRAIVCDNAICGGQ